MRFRHFLKVIDGPDIGLSFELDRQCTKVGRDKNKAHFVLSDKDISRLHCQIVRQGDELFLEDLKSSNGCRVNGSQVTRGKIGPGDRLTLGQNVLELTTKDPRVKKQDGKGRFFRHPESADGSLEAGKTRRRVRLSVKFVMMQVVLALAGGVIIGLPLIKDLSVVVRNLELERYATLGLAVAAANQQALVRSDAVWVSTAWADNREGVRSVEIVDGRGMIMAPVSRLHQQSQDPLVTRALNENRIIDARTKPDTFTLVIPVNPPPTETNLSKPIGAVRLEIVLDNLNQIILWAFLLLVILVGAFLALSVLGAVSLSRMVERHIRQSAEDTSLRMSGELKHMPRRGASPALDELAVVVDQAMATAALAVPRAAAGHSPRGVDSPPTPGGPSVWGAALAGAGESPMLVLSEDNMVLDANRAFSQWQGHEGSVVNEHLFDVFQDQQLRKAALLAVKNLLEQERESVALRAEGASGMTLRASRVLDPVGAVAYLTLKFQRQSPDAQGSRAE